MRSVLKAVILLLGLSLAQEVFPTTAELAKEAEEITNLQWAKEQAFLRRFKGRADVPLVQALVANRSLFARKQGFPGQMKYAEQVEPIRRRRLQGSSKRTYSVNNFRERAQRYS